MKLSGSPHKNPEETLPMLGEISREEYKRILQQRAEKDESNAKSSKRCRDLEPSRQMTGSNRKQYPIATGVIDYFPDALVEIANVSFIGNEQHNPGQPLHWDRSKSTDEADALMRHFVDRGKRDTDGLRHSAKVAWRALALLQKEIEAEKKPS